MAAGLQLGDDLVGDLGVKASRGRRPLMWCVWTSRFSATGPEASPPAFSPSRQTRSAPSLSATVTPPALWQTGFAGRAAVFASGMEAQRVKTREAGLQSSRQPDPAGRRRHATQVVSAELRLHASKRWNQRRTHPHVALFLGRLTAKRELDCGGALRFV